MLYESYRARMINYLIWALLCGLSLILVINLSLYTKKIEDLSKGQSIVYSPNSADKTQIN